MKMIDPIKNVLKRGAESAKYKYSLIISLIGLVHVCLVVLFSFLRVPPMVLINIGSVMIYIACLVAIRHDGDMRAVFYATYLEIIARPLPPPYASAGASAFRSMSLPWSPLAIICAMR